MKRKRCLNTFMIFRFLATSLVLNTCFRNSTVNKDYERLASPGALSNARKKCSAVFKNIFEDIVKTIPNRCKNRIVAVDGSKIKLFKSSEKDGYTPRSSKSKRPIAMLSTLYDVTNSCVLDISVCKHLKLS